MDLKKYSELREKIKDQDFETKNKDIDSILNVSSYLGNIASIFFAFFLLFPALEKAISANLTADYSAYVGGFVSVLILSGFELLKRKVVSNFSLDVIMNKFKITRNLISWGIFSVAIICASFYFSLNGAINFASTSGEQNQIIENTIQDQIDSVSNIYAQRIQIIYDDNNSYRESNKQLRDKIAETPIDYRTVRNDLQKQIEGNNEAIDNNDKKIKLLETEQSLIIDEIKKSKNEKKSENENEDYDNIILFLIISTSIEFIIILGIYFDKYYDFNVFLLRSNELEAKYKKRDRYKKLVGFIYKEGNVGIDQPIIGKTKLIDLVKDKTNIHSPIKFVNDFFDDMEYLGIFKIHGKRRYTKISYDEALDKLSKIDDSLKLIEDLK